MESKKERNNIIDVMKGIMILFVVIYHLIYRKQGCLFDKIVREMIYLSMPLFFCLAGYFYRDKEGSFFQNFVGRLKRLLIPSLVCTLVLLLVLGPYYVLTHNEYTLNNWLTDFLMTYLRPELMAVISPDATGEVLFNNISPVWFIWALFFATIIFYLVMNFVRSDNRKLIIATAIFLIAGIIIYEFTPKLSWSLNLAPLYAGIMMTGVIIKKYNVVEKLGAINLGISCIIMVICAVLHFIIFNKLGSDLIYMSILGDKPYISSFLFIIQIFIGGFVLFSISRLISLSSAVNSAFSWVGRHTLTILLFHCVIAGLMVDALNTYNKPGPDWYVDPLTAEIVIKSIISFIIGLGGSIGLCILNDKIKNKHRNS